MMMIPFPLVLAEIAIFVMAAQEWGFWTTLGYYLLPSLLGMIIMSVVGRLALFNLQGSVAQGKVPANKMLHSGALFFSGLLFLIPSFFSRVLAVLLLLPGTRHFLVWRFKKSMSQNIMNGSSRIFQFGGFGGGFSTGPGGGFEFTAGFGDHGPRPAGEREVSEANVLDVKPLQVTHEANKKEEESE